MLMVIFGAGASYDSIYAQQSQGQPSRMPLANELFENRAAFRNTAERFPDCLDIMPRLQAGAGRGVESLLQEYFEETNERPHRRRQLAAIRYYLQLILWDCQSNWLRLAQGQTNYKTLLDDILQYYTERPVALVTFNYDNILERAISERTGFTFDTLDSYIGGDLKVFKLHGSLNWARRIDVPESVRTSTVNADAWLASNELIRNVDALEIKDKFDIVGDVPTWRSQYGHALPALALPLVTKNTFECPTTHVKELEALLPEIDNVLIIGWRAGEAHFVEMLRQHLHEDAEFLVVARDVTDADQTWKVLRESGVRGSYDRSEGGFSSFVMSSRPKTWLLAR